MATYRVWVTKTNFESGEIQPELEDYIEIPNEELEMFDHHGYSSREDMLDDWLCQSANNLKDDVYDVDWALEPIDAEATGAIISEVVTEEYSEEDYAAAWGRYTDDQEMEVEFESDLLEVT